MNGKILVVDDDPDVRYLTNYLLTQQGYEVELASDGRAALRLLEDGVPDLILLDVMMPGASGLDVLEDVRRDADRRAVPVVMLTARAQADDIHRAIELDVADYIVKPFSPAELVTRVADALSRAGR